MVHNATSEQICEPLCCPMVSSEIIHMLVFFFFKRLTNQQLWKMCPGGNSVPLITKHGAISSIFFKAALINRVRTMISSFGHHIILLVFPL